jgi:hypothetical protein
VILRNAGRSGAVKWNIWRALVLVSTLVSAVMAAGAPDKW